MSRSSVVTGSTLGALSALHVAWGLGSSFPFPNRAQLADAVIGRASVPSSRACFSVATLLAVGAGVVLHLVPMPRWLRSRALAVMAAILALRGVAGFGAKTSLLSKGSDSERFRRLDRRVFSPLCLLLAIGSLGARN